MTGIFLTTLIFGFLLFESKAMSSDLDVSLKGNKKQTRDVDTVARQEYFHHEIEQMSPKAPGLIDPRSHTDDGVGNMFDVASVDGGLVYTTGEHFWTEWSDWSICSRTCGRGVTSRTRQCISKHIRSAEGRCTGPNMDHNLCSTQDCPQGSPDFRAVQCGQQNRQLSNSRNLKWIPFSGLDSDPCELLCIASTFDFFHSFGQAKDGTRCGTGGKDICIQGKCTKFGCNNHIRSNMEEDACGVCGGHNDTCSYYQNVYDSFPDGGENAGYKTVAKIPIGATHITVKDYNKNYLALKETDGVTEKYIVNGDWVITWPGKFKTAGTTVKYQRENEKETFEIVGPTTKEVDIMVLCLEQEPIIEYEYWAPNSARTSNNGLGEWKMQRKIIIEIPNEEDYIAQIKRSGLDFDAVIPPTAEPTTNTLPTTTTSSTTSTISVTTEESNEINVKPKPGVHRPSQCTTCKKSVKVRKSFCESDFVLHVRVRSAKRLIRGEFSRYEVEVLSVYKRNFRVLKREYIWISNSCCPKLKPYRHYLLMGRKVRTDVTKGAKSDGIDVHSGESPHYETRLLADYSHYWQFWKKYQARMARISKHFNCKRFRYTSNLYRRRQNQS